MGRASWFHLLSSCAAGQLFDILGEGLRRELQPLDHRQVGEQLVSQFLYGHAVTDREHRRLDQLARFRGHCLYPNESSATFLGLSFRI